MSQEDGVRAVDDELKAQMPSLSATATALSVTIIAGEGSLSAGVQAVFDAAKNILVRAAAKAPKKTCEIRLQGTFRPTETITINWPERMKQQLAIEGGGSAVISAENLPDGKTTVTCYGAIAVRGLRFPGTKGHGVQFSGRFSVNYEVSDCYFEECTKSAVRVYSMGSAELISSDPKTVRGKIVNNNIHGFNREDSKWMNDGISVFDQGVIIAGNYITDSPTECAGIRAMGRDILIERNWVEGVSVKDSGGIYLGVATSHAAAFRGRVVQHNYVSGAVKGIYLDDGTSGTTVVENVVVGSDKCAIYVSGGRDNIITRNVLDGPTSYQFHLDSRCLGWAWMKNGKLVHQLNPKGGVKAEQWVVSFEELRDILLDPEKGPVFRARYPELGKWNEENLVASSFNRPEGNVFSDNFSRNIETTFELKRSSPRNHPDFEAWNTLTPAAEMPSGTPEDLQTADLGRWFGFEGMHSVARNVARIARDAA